MARHPQTEPYQHDTETRTNNSSAGLAPDGDIPDMPRNTYAYSPHLQPVLRFDAEFNQNNSHITTIHTTPSPPFHKR